MKILNLHAALGGNRKYWEGHKITAVELDPKIAKVYSKLYPNDELIIGDAYEYLLNHYNEFDFIWASPPCQANSRMIRSGKNRKPRLPDLKLYEIKIFLDYNCNGLYAIENVIPYYKPVIEPTAKLGRHLFWSNFHISEFEVQQPKNFITTGTLKGAEELKEWLGIKYEGSIYYDGNHDPCQVLRNCVHPDLGMHVLYCAQLVF